MGRDGDGGADEDPPIEPAGQDREYGEERHVHVGLIGMAREGVDHQHDLSHRGGRTGLPQQPVGAPELPDQRRKQGRSGTRMSAEGLGAPRSSRRPAPPVPCSSRAERSETVRNVRGASARCSFRRSPRAVNLKQMRARDASATSRRRRDTARRDGRGIRDADGDGAVAAERQGVASGPRNRRDDLGGRPGPVRRPP